MAGWVLPAITAGASVLSSAASYAAAKETNKGNKEINDANLAFQREQMERDYEKWKQERLWTVSDRANEWSREDYLRSQQWQREDALRAEQRAWDKDAIARDFAAYRQLGLNPYLMMADQNGASTIGSGQSVSTQGNPSTGMPSASTPSFPVHSWSPIAMQTPNLDFSGAAAIASQAISVYNNERVQAREDLKAKADATTKFMNAITEAKDKMSQKSWREADAALKRAQESMERWQYKFNDETRDIQILTKQKEAELLAENARNLVEKRAIDWYNAETSRMDAKTRAKVGDAQIRSFIASAAQLFASSLYYDELTTSVRNQNFVDYGDVNLGLAHQSKKVQYQLEKLARENGFTQEEIMDKQGIVLKVLKALKTQFLEGIFSISANHL